MNIRDYLVTCQAARLRSVELREASDGVVTLRAPAAGDGALLISGRDDEFRRWLGEGSDDPRPTACIVVGGEVVGWIDYDAENAWLEQSAVNIGYALFADARGEGYATRAVALLLGELAARTEFEAATVLIDPHNVRSLGVARRNGFVDRGEIDGQLLLTRRLRD